MTVDQTGTAHLEVRLPAPHAKMGMLGQNIAVKALEDLLNRVQNGQSQVAPGDVTRLLDTSVKVPGTPRKRCVGLRNRHMLAHTGRTQLVILSQRKSQHGGSCEQPISFIACNAMGRRAPSAIRRASKFWTRSQS
jgi:hypothetical protein